jgi:hypothetical protein
MFIKLKKVFVSVIVIIFFSHFLDRNKFIGYVFHMRLLRNQIYLVRSVVYTFIVFIYVFYNFLCPEMLKKFYTRQYRKNNNLLVFSYN